MVWLDIATAFALCMVIEGLLPFISPEGFKRRLAGILSLSNQTLRIIGLASMLAGVVLLYAVR